MSEKRDVTALLLGLSEQRNVSTPLFQDLRETPLCQQWDKALVTVGLPAETEEWADDALRECDFFKVWRDEDGILYVQQEIGGNTNAVSVARGVLDDIEDALGEVEVDPSHLILRVEGQPGSA